MADELLPCPFCGGEGLEVVTGKAGQNRYKIVCSGCGVKTFETVASPLHREAWNRRHERMCRAIPKEPRWAACECSVCGGVLESFNKFCPNCGAKVVAVDERTCKVVRYDAGGGAIWLTCSECGNIMPEHDNYCSSCGARVVRE